MKTQITTKSQAEDLARQGVNGVIGSKGVKIAGKPMIANAIMRSLIQVASGSLRDAMTPQQGSLGGAHSITIVTNGGCEVFDAFVEKLLGSNFITGYGTTSWSEAIDTLLSGEGSDIKTNLSERYVMSEQDRKVFNVLLDPKMQGYLQQTSAARSVIRICHGNKSTPCPGKEWALLASQVAKAVKNAKTYSQVMRENSGMPDYATKPGSGLGPLSTKED